MADITIDAKGKEYRELNSEIRKAIREGKDHISITGVLGQRFIGDGIDKKVKIDIDGVAGGDLGAFMNGPTIHVRGNADHAAGNTMTGGTIIIEGNTGDCAGHSMRGGKLFIKGSVGYRVGIHMKQYKDKYPIIIIGGNAEAFLGEYMAGGIIVLLGLDEGETVGDYIGTGMHGGKIFIAGRVKKEMLGVAASKGVLTEQDLALLDELVQEYGEIFNKDVKSSDFVFSKIEPISSRPFSNLYTYE